MEQSWQLSNTSLGIAFLVASFVVFYLIGWYSNRASKSVADLYIAGGTIGPLANGLGMASTYMSLATFLGVTALILKLQVPFVYMWIQFILAIPLITILFGTSLRRMGAFTPAHFVRERYGKTAAVVSACWMILIMLMYALGQMIGIAKAFETLLGIPYAYGLAFGGLLIVGYITLGGMYGASYNAAFQMVMMGIAFIIPLGAIMKAMGSSGWWFPPLLYGDMVKSMLEVAPDFFDPKYGVKWYFALIPSLTLGGIGLPHLAMRVFTASSLRSARAAMVWYALILGMVFSATYTMGFAGVYFSQSTGTVISPTDADKITIILNLVYNPEWVTALVIVGAIAAGLSTLNGNLLAIGALVAQDIISTLKPNLAEKSKMVIGYVAIATAGIVSILLAFKPPAFLVVSILWAFGLAATVSAPLVIMGVWWKEANKYGAIAASLIAGLVYILVSPYVAPSITLSGDALTDKLGLSGALLSAPLSFIILIVVSYVTNRIPSLAVRIPRHETEKLIESIHGWSTVNPMRYNSTAGAFTIAGICAVLVIWALMPW
ncbi:sodium:solute symporter family transporter [Calderihabitans maritimus]|uniref:Sodium:solute symporter n=1 Tax=Calderihabitans maritimus TaxID=1246530 RepID=A0A1Z5HY75_9FIRM|nr:sodium:solute symporter [Calderihabitans maritimus]GAW94291.1 sodium:solute symporter [Calderihabitans maritimus]